MREEMRRMKGRKGEVEMSNQGNERDRMAIERRPGWRSLVLTSRLIYIRKLTLKWSLNYVRVTNPSTPILGISQLHYHMILQDNNARHHISALVQRYV
jgi:hypothetical protein